MEWGGAQARPRAEIFLRGGGVGSGWLVLCLSVRIFGRENPVFGVVKNTSFRRTHTNSTTFGPTKAVPRRVITPVPIPEIVARKASVSAPE